MTRYFDHSTSNPKFRYNKLYESEDNLWNRLLLNLDYNFDGLGNSASSIVREFLDNKPIDTEIYKFLEKVKSSIDLPKDYYFNDYNWFHPYHDEIYHFLDVDLIIELFDKIMPNLSFQVITIYGNSSYFGVGHTVLVKPTPEQELYLKFMDYV